MDDLRLSETAYLNVPERDKSPSPGDSLSSSISDISTAPIHVSRRKVYGGVTGHLIFAIAAGALGSSFQHGYNTGVLNAPQNLITAFINSTYYNRFQIIPEKDTVDLIFSIIVSVFCVGGMIGALMTAYIGEKFGRKGGLLINNIFVFIATGFMGFSKTFGSYEMLIIGRFFIGLNSGLAAGLAPMYLTEISPINLRGAVGTIYQLIIVIAILTSNILGFSSLLGTESLWPMLFVVSILPSIFMLATLPFCPESPKHVLIIQGKEIAAQKALTWFRGTIEVHDEMDEMRAESESMKLVPRVTLSEIWKNPTLRQPMIISVVVMLSQQLSGINAAIFFSTSIFESAGLDQTQSQYSTLGMSVINCLMTICSLVLVEKCGRRTLHLIGLGGMAVTTVVLAICIQFNSIAFLRYISILAVFVFVIMFATGPGSIPWFLVGELFGIGARAIATSIAVAVNWIANFMVGLLFLPLSNLLQGYVFLVFTVLLVFFWLYTYKKVPETKGKTPEEIGTLFRQKAYQQ